MLLSPGSPCNRPHSPKNDSSSGATPRGPYRDLGIGNITRSHLTKHGKVHAEAGNYRQETTIDILPDNVFLEIFYLCRVNQFGYVIYPTWKWHRLAQVCRRWRYIIFASPRHLDLKLVFAYGKPVWEDLGYKSAFPIAIEYSDTSIHNCGKCLAPDDVKNIIAAFAEPNRVHRIDLNVTHSLSVLLAVIAVDKPFLALEELSLFATESIVHALKLPNGFLGGSAPNLHFLHLSGIPFPALPRLLSSTNNLVSLYLDDIPPAGYISPEAMAAGLAALTRLKSLFIEFSSYHSAPTGDVASPETRVVLPALISFNFAGNGEYLEHLVAQIDTPRLESIRIKHSCEIGFRIPQLFQFIDRSTNFKQKLPLLTHAQILFEEEEASFSVNDEWKSPFPPLDICVLCECEEIDCQVSRMALILSQSSTSTLFSHIQYLSISCPDPSPYLEEVDPIQWLELFYPFVAVRILRVGGCLIEDIALALKEVTPGVMILDLLPAMRFLDLGSDPKPYVDAGTFISFRRIFGILVTAITYGDNPWETDRGLYSESDFRVFDDGPGSNFGE